MTDSRLAIIRKLIEREQYANAWTLTSELMNEEPDNPKALYMAGWVLRSQGHVGMALQMFRRALALAPKVVNIWMHYSACLHDVHKYDEAREGFRMVMKQLPNDPMPLANISAGYAQQGKAREAVEWAQKTFAMNPNPPEGDAADRIARISMSFGSLALGRWAEGWEYADVLYGDRVIIRQYTERDEPVWDGSKGKTVVVQSDQGLGDQIMFAQCLGDMVRDCKKVIVETNPRLQALLGRNFPEIDVYATLKQEKIEWPLKYDIDARIHISYLGKHYRKNNAEFPRKAYLKPDEEKVAKWRKWLEQFPRPWVGLAWRGGIPQTNSISRSMELAELAPIIKMGGSFINMSYQDVELEVARWNIENREQVIMAPIDNGGDYDETFALLAALDHVVTVTTTVAHACGAMGRKAAVIVNESPQWRYCYRIDDGTGMIWYPQGSVNLYRVRPGEQDWSHVVARVAKDYEAFVLPLAA